MKKILSALLAIMMITTIFAGCSKPAPAPAPAPAPGAPAPAPAPSPEKKYEWTMGTAYDQKAPPAVAAAKFAEDMNKATNGNVTINFHTNSAIGTEKDQMIAVAADELEFTLGGMLSLDMYAPDYGFFSAPYLFKDMDHLKNLIDSDIGIAMKKKLTDANLNPIGLMYRGIRNTSSNTPINSPDDLKGIKIRMTELPSWVAIWGKDGLGGTTIPIPLGELYSALQTGVVSASEGPYEQLANNKFYEVQKCLVNTKHVYEWCALYVSEKLRASLSPELQATMDKLAKEDMTDYGSKLAEEKAEGFRQELLKGGMQEVNPDIAPFGEKVKSVYDKFFKEVWTASTYEDVMKYAK